MACKGGRKLSRANEVSADEGDQRDMTKRTVKAHGAEQWATHDAPCTWCVQTNAETLDHAAKRVRRECVAEPVSRKVTVG